MIIAAAAAGGPIWTDILTAWATLALAILAFVTAILAYLAWRKQAREVSDQAEMLRIQAEQLAEDRKVNAEQIRVLALQAEELSQLSADRQREARGRRRSQAALVYMWTMPLIQKDAPISFMVELRNTSQQPVYSVRFDWNLNGKRLARNGKSWLQPLMPGEKFDANLEPPQDTSPGINDIVATFCDRSGTWWHTWLDGRLVESAEPSAAGWLTPSDEGEPEGKTAS
jgi:cbb3-type cytochrome oxidase subunit 3